MRTFAKTREVDHKFFTSFELKEGAIHPQFFIEQCSLARSLQGHSPFHVAIKSMLKTGKRRHVKEFLEVGFDMYQSDEMHRRTALSQIFKRNVKINRFKPVIDLVVKQFGFQPKIKSTLKNGKPGKSLQEKIVELMTQLDDDYESTLDESDWEAMDGTLETEAMIKIALLVKWTKAFDWKMFDKTYEEYEQRLNDNIKSLESRKKVKPERIEKARKRVQFCLKCKMIIDTSRGQQTTSEIVYLNQILREKNKKAEKEDETVEPNFGHLPIDYLKDIAKYL